MFRHSIKKGRENYHSIEELKKNNESWGPPVNQPNFDMINTLMVVNLEDKKMIENSDAYDSTTNSSNGTETGHKSRELC